MQGGQATAPGRGDTQRDAAVAARLSEVLGGERVNGLRRLSGGASRETYSFEAEGQGALILQCERGGKPTGEPAAQAALLEAAKAAGVPVAAVVAHGRDDPLLGDAWTLVAALSGTSDPVQIVSAEPEGVPALLDDIASALAAVHRMPEG